MRLLLTSGGINNSTIYDALTDLLDKPIEESVALAIPTAQHGHPMCTPASLRRFVAGEGSDTHMCALGWKSIGVLELLALPTMDKQRWLPWLQEADVLLVDGGEATYLAHWMRETGLADMLPSLLSDTVWVGVSAGSMVLTPRIGRAFVSWPSAQDDSALGIVDFSIFPHLDAFPENTLADAERWATEIGIPGYAIDEQTAIKVVDGEVEVVSEGKWKRWA